MQRISDTCIPIIPYIVTGIYEIMTLNWHNMQRMRTLDRYLRSWANELIVNALALKYVLFYCICQVDLPHDIKHMVVACPRGVIQNPGVLE